MIDELVLIGDDLLAIVDREVAIGVDAASVAQHHEFGLIAHRLFGLDVGGLEAGTVAATAGIAPDRGEQSRGRGGGEFPCNRVLIAPPHVRVRAASAVRRAADAATYGREWPRREKHDEEREQDDAEIVRELAQHALERVRRRRSRRRRRRWPTAQAAMKLSIRKRRQMMPLMPSANEEKLRTP